MTRRPDGREGAALSGAPARRPALAPLRLRPMAKERVWGGSRLETMVADLPRQGLRDGAPVGEAWLLADLPDSVADGRSVVDDGPSAGRTLRSVIADDPRPILGRARLSAEGGFPLLVKLLDARENLSVQVHPTPHHARRRPGAHVKDETWFVLDAAPGAVVYTGLRPGVGRDEVARRAADGSLESALIAAPVRPGDVVDLPSGTCHALGAGIAVAEVQTPSDTTYRLFDWARTGRELHLDEALACMFDHPGTPGTPGGLGAAVRHGPASREIDSGAFRTRRLCATPNYRVERIEAVASPTCPTLPVVTDGMPVILLPLGGGGTLTGTNERRDLRRGWATLVPAALEGWTLAMEPGTVLLRIEVPEEGRRVEG